MKNKIVNIALISLIAIGLSGCGSRYYHTSNAIIKQPKLNSEIKSNMSRVVLTFNTDRWTKGKCFKTSEKYNGDMGVFCQGDTFTFDTIEDYLELSTVYNTSGCCPRTRKGKDMYVLNKDSLNNFKIDGGYQKSLDDHWIKKEWEVKSKVDKALERNRKFDIYADDISYKLGQKLKKYILEQYKIKYGIDEARKLLGNDIKKHREYVAKFHYAKDYGKVYNKLLNMEYRKAMKDYNVSSFNYFINKYGKNTKKSALDKMKIERDWFKAKNIYDGLNDTIKIDMIKTDLKGYLKNLDYRNALISFRFLKDLNQLNTPAMIYYYADTLEKNGRKVKAKRMCQKWLNTFDKSNKYYSKVIELYSKVR
jgi:hypothetical protein